MSDRESANASPIIAISAGGSSEGRNTPEVPLHRVSFIDEDSAPGGGGASSVSPLIGSVQTPPGGSNMTGAPAGVTSFGAFLAQQEAANISTGTGNGAATVLAPPQVSFLGEEDVSPNGNATPIIEITQEGSFASPTKRASTDFNIAEPEQTHFDDSYRNGYQPTRGDLLALATLQKEMTNSLDARDELKSRIAEASWLVMNHHANFALDNVTVARNAEEYAEAIQEKQVAVKNLEIDVGYAEAEQMRLRELNESLLQGIREKEAEKQRVKTKLQTFAECEKRMIKSTVLVQNQTAKIEHEEQLLAQGTVQFTGKTGSHHADLMFLEQTQLDLTLEAESLKKRVLQLTGAPPEPKEGWERPNYEHLFHPCANPECIRTRRQVQNIKSRVESLQQHIKRHNSSSSSHGGLSRNSSSDFNTPSAASTLRSLKNFPKYGK